MNFYTYIQSSYLLFYHEYFFLFNIYQGFKYLPFPINMHGVCIRKKQKNVKRGFIINKGSIVEKKKNLY